MRITPITFKMNYADKQTSAKDFVPIPMRYNSLRDLEFDIISDKIRSENLKNQMTLKLAQLKKNINDFINPNNK